MFHIYDDFKIFGPLDGCSCFCFENFMQIIKNKIRKPEKPLEQLANRYREQPFKFHYQNVKDQPNQILLTKPVSQWHTTNNTNEISQTTSQFTQLNIHGFSLRTYTTSKKNSHYISKEKEVVQIHAFNSNSDRKIEIFGYSFQTTDWFDKPCKSGLLGIFELGEMSPSLKIWGTDDVDKKCLILSKNDITDSSF